MNRSNRRAADGIGSRRRGLLSGALGLCIAAFSWAGCGGESGTSGIGGAVTSTSTTSGTTGSGASGGGGSGTTSSTAGGGGSSTGGAAGGGGTTSTSGGSGGATTGSGGSGGSSTGTGGSGGMTGTGGSGGMTATGGAGGMTGTGGSGGGACAPIAGAGCTPCLTNACCPEFDTCNASDNCKRCLIGDPAAVDCAADAAFLSFGMCATASCDAECFSCAGHFTGACDYCMRDSCCAEVTACAGDPACMDCLTATPGDPACAGNAAAQAALACANTNCSASCLKAPSGAGCDAPVAAPSGGSCVALGGDVQCNPVTNEGCNVMLGEACDSDIVGFACRPPPNEKGLCQDCDYGVPCAAGMTCAGGGICVRYCCTDADCGTGTCDVAAVPGGNGPIGLCRGGAAPVVPPASNHCDWLEGEACEACCEKAYPGGQPTYAQMLGSCACGACAAACASVCPGDLTTASSACMDCVADAFEVGTCDPTPCHGDAACDGFLKCATACED